MLFRVNPSKSVLSAFQKFFSMKSNTCLLSILMMIVSTGFSQDHKWYYNYNTGKSETGDDIVYGADGYVYVAGLEYDDTDYDIVVIKLSKSGNQEWVYSFEGEQDQTAEVNKIHYGSDGNLYICGFTENASGNNKFLVFSLTSAGEFRWEYRYDNSGNYSSVANSVVYNSNGMVYAAGEANYDFLVTAINATTGSQEWIYWFDGSCPYSLCDDMASSIALGTDGNIYAGGYSYNSNDKQLVVVSLTAAGSLNWKYLHPAFNVGYSVATDLVFGKDNRIYASCVIGSDIGALCLNTAGEYQWDCTIDGPGPEPVFGETCYELLYGIDENLYIVGRAAGRDATVDTDLDAVVMKVNRQGNAEWFYRYEGLYGTFDMAFSIVQTPDTNVHVAAYSCGLLAEANMISLHHITGRDLWVMRYIGPAMDMDVAYAITADEDGFLYLTGYDYKASRLHDIYVWKLDPPRNTDGYYNLEGNGTAGCGYAVMETTDKNIAIAGYQGSSATNSTFNMRLVKTDINGDTIWTKSFGGNQEDRAYDFVQCLDQGFLLTGFTKSTGSGGRDLYLVRTDKNGNRLWEKTYGYDTDEEGVSITAANDGGYFIAGKTTKYDGSGDLWFMKISADGDSLWTRLYGGNRRDEVGEVHTTADDGFIFAGTRGHSLTMGYITNIYVIRFNADGDTLWTREFINDDYYDQGGDIIEQSDGTFILVGYYTNSEYIAKLDNEGNILWDKMPHTEQNGGFNSVARNNDGNYIMSRNGFGSKEMIYVAVYDPEGNFISADTAAYSPGNVYMPTRGWVYDAQPASHGGYLAVGEGRISGGSMLNANIILYRKGGVLTKLPLPPLGIDEILIPGGGHPRQLRLTPNPASEQLVIGFTLPSQADVTIMVTDLQGRTIYQSVYPNYLPGDHNIEWKPGKISDGIYICHILAGKENFTGKIIIKK
jgi:hypothetical protein